MIVKSAVGVGVALWALTAGMARASCPPIDHSPRLRPFEAGVVEPLVYAPAGSGQVRWGAMRNESPHDGIVYAFDCGGRALGELRLGYLLDWRPGPWVGGLPTVEARYVGATGTGMWTSWVALLQFREGKVVELWSHIAVDSFAGLEPNTATRHRWRYRGGRIEVTGVRTTGPIRNMRTAQADGRSEKLADESYCYVAEHSRFERCGP